MKDARIVPEMLMRHSEEAAFLWILRDAATQQPHYSLSDLARLDSRVDAHIDALRIAGDDGWAICNESLRVEEAGEIFAAAVLAFESGQKNRIDTVVQSGTASPQLSGALVAALGWVTFLQVEPYITQLLATSSPLLRSLGIAAAAVHRQNPGPPLVSALAHADSFLKARALRTVGELGLGGLLNDVREHVSAREDYCRFSAAWSVTILSVDLTSLDILRSVTESNLPYREKALQVAVRRMDLPVANAWQKKLAEDPKQVRIAIIAAGAVGDPVKVPWLIEQMKDQENARLAGEAFTMITGVDIAYQDLDSDAPEGFVARPTENPEDENVEMDPDENLPWPNAEPIAKWWSAHQAEFQKGTRYLLGKPATADWMERVLRIGRQRQRAAAALELAILQPGRPLFNVKAPGFRQQQALGLR
jgi:uncharacterized protein (TIGR02270 family)